MSTQKLKVDQKLLIDCVEGCFKDKNKVFGKNAYADITYICASAVHAGVIMLDGGKFRMQLDLP